MRRTLLVLFEGSRLELPRFLGPLVVRHIFVCFANTAKDFLNVIVEVKLYLRIFLFEAHSLIRAIFQIASNGSENRR